MNAKNRKFIDSVGDFFFGVDQTPWCDRDYIIGCEREVAEANKGSCKKTKYRSTFSFLSALVHSRLSEDVQRGIAMLEDAVSDLYNPLHMPDVRYLLAVGYYRSGDYTRSRYNVDRCFMATYLYETEVIRAQTLKKTIEKKITRDGVGIIGIGIAATASALVVGGLQRDLLSVLLALARKK